jgi:hypothetical protein
MFIGTEGWVHVDREKLDAQPASLLQIKPGANDVRLFKSDNHGVNFIEAVKGRSKPAAPIEIAVRTSPVESAMTCFSGRSTTTSGYPCSSITLAAAARSR